MFQSRPLEMEKSTSAKSVVCSVGSTISICYHSEPSFLLALAISISACSELTTHHTTLLSHGINQRFFYVLMYNKIFGGITEKLFFVKKKTSANVFTKLHYNRSPSKPLSIIIVCTVHTYLHPRLLLGLNLGHSVCSCMRSVLPTHTHTHTHTSHHHKESDHFSTVRTQLCL